MKSFLDLDCGEYSFWLEPLLNYNISYLYENYIDKVIFGVNLDLHKITVRFNRLEKCFVIFVSNRSTKIVIDAPVLYSLRETIDKSQELINYYIKVDKLKSFT